MDMSPYKMECGFNLQINRIWFRGPVTCVCWAMVDFPAVWLSDTGMGHMVLHSCGDGGVSAERVCLLYRRCCCEHLLRLCTTGGVSHPQPQTQNWEGVLGRDAKSASEPRLSERPSQRTLSSGVCGRSTSPAFSGTWSCPT